jgi:hypothetical protein
VHSAEIDRSYTQPLVHLLDGGGHGREGLDLPTTCVGCLQRVVCLRCTHYSDYCCTAALRMRATFDGSVTL